jgi:hypothetical protein
MRQAQAEAWSWIRRHPGQFASLTARRMANVWIGPIDEPFQNVIGVLALTCLALAGLWVAWPRLTIPQRAALLIPLVAFPMVYYIAAYSPRYRIPLDWVFYILAGAALWQGVRWTRARM